MKDVFAKIAEEQIQDAMRKGEFDNLEGKGKPLAFEDDSMVPPDLRMAYKLLKNAGYVPEEVLEQREVQNVLDLLESCQDEQERYRQIRRLNFMITKMNMTRRRPVALEQEQLYYEKVVEKITLPGRSRDTNKKR